MRQPTHVWGLRPAAILGAFLATFLSCGGTGGRLPSQLSRFPNDLSNPKLELSGIYQDGWAADTASASLLEPSGESAVLVRGTVPQISDAAFRTDIQLRVNDQEIARQTVGIGDFQIAAPADGTPGDRRVTLVFSATQQLPAGDGRAVGAHLQFFGFVPSKSVPGLQVRDIVLGPEIRLADGWGVLETFQHQTFRWVENDAQILITPAKGGDMALSLTVEPGPGVGGKCLLKVVDSAGRQVAATPLGRRSKVKLFVSADAAKTSEFRLHVDNGGKRIPNDQRILNFRVFDIKIEPWKQAPASR